MSKMRVCLDAGHFGKYNRSPVVKSYYESEMTWALHLKLKAQLEGLEAEKDSANEQLEGYTGRDGVVASYEKLLKAADDYYSGEYGAALEALEQLDETVSGTNYQAVYRKLRQIWEILVQPSMKLQRGPWSRPGIWEVL